MAPAIGTCRGRRALQWSLASIERRACWGDLIRRADVGGAPLAVTCHVTDGAGGCGPPALLGAVAAPEQHNEAELAPPSF